MSELERPPARSGKRVNSTYDEQEKNKAMKLERIFCLTREQHSANEAEEEDRYSCI